MKIQSTLDSARAYWMMTLYGPSGDGKTLASSTAANQFRVEFPIGEGDGGRTLSDKNIPTVQITGWYDFLQLLWGLNGGPLAKIAGVTPDVVISNELYSKLKNDKATKALIEGVKKIAPETIVFDSFTALQNLMMKQSRAHWGRDVGQTHWGDLARMAEWAVELCVTLPYNFVFVTQQTRITDSDIGRNFYVPYFPGKASHDIVCPKMTYILPIQVRPDLKEWGKNRNRWFQTQSDGRYMVKARVPHGLNLPDQVPASIEKFMKNLQKNTKKTGAKKK